MAFIKLTLREPAPYSETRCSPIWINAADIVFIREGRTPEGARYSRVALIVGGIHEVEETPETITRIIGRYDT